MIQQMLAIWSPVIKVKKKNQVITYRSKCRFEVHQVASVILLLCNETHRILLSVTLSRLLLCLTFGSTDPAGTQLHLAARSGASTLLYLTLILCGPATTWNVVFPRQKAGYSTCQTDFKSFQTSFHIISATNPLARETLEPSLKTG